MHVFIAQDNLDTLSNHENQLVWIGENIRAQTKRYKIQTPAKLLTRESKRSISTDALKELLNLGRHASSDGVYNKG